MTAALPEPGVLVAVLAIMVLAGTVKGSLGIGFPAVAMSLLPIVVAPALGVALLAVPIFVTNAIQFLSVSGWPAIVRRFLVGGVSVALTIFVVVQFVAQVPGRWVEVAVGVSLILFSAASLLKIELPMSEGAGWQALVGVTSGLLGGVSAVKAPIMIYAVGLKLPRDEFVCAAGFLFFMGGLGLTVGTLSAALLDGPGIVLSLAATAVALLGFRVGAAIRRRLSDAVFRSVLLWVILALGLRLILTDLL